MVYKGLEQKQQNVFFIFMLIIVNTIVYGSIFQGVVIVIMVYQ